MVMRKYIGDHRTDLERFMRRVGATTLSVATDTKLSQPTVWRAMAGEATPDLETYREVNRWALAEAERLNLPRSEWLNDWPAESAA